jgi:hypothetical protein
MLVERLNTHWSLQTYCGIQLRPQKISKDEALPGRRRRYFGKCHQAVAAATYATNENLRIMVLT